MEWINVYIVLKHTHKSQRWVMSVTVDPSFCTTTDTKALKSFPLSFSINCAYAWSAGWEWFDKLLFFFFFFSWPTKFYDGMAWHIFTTHAWCIDTVRVVKYRFLFGQTHAHSCTLPNGHVNARSQSGTHTLKAFYYILGSSVIMTKCAPSHTTLQTQPWFPLAAHSSLSLHTCQS